MSVIRRSRLKIVFAAVRAPDRLAKLVHGALVEHEVFLIGEDLVAELASHLKAD